MAFNARPAFHARPEPRRLAPSDLAEILRDESVKPPLIIDVRDADFAGGHIRGAINIPEDGFLDDDDVDALVSQYCKEDRIVFHCMMSQVRGPSCARRFMSRMAVVLEGVAHQPNVLVLAGGYELFSRLYKGDKTLFEDVE